MHESQDASRSALLPKRMVHRVPLIEPQESAATIAAGLDNWGLTGRIGALPGIAAIRSVLDDGATATDYFVDEAYVMRHPCNGPQHFCRVDMDGISLPQLDPGDRSEIVLKGWAARADDMTVVYLPRDSIEMEIAWQILLQAYQYLATRQPLSDRRRKVMSDLPKCASTAKYWM